MKLLIDCGGSGVKIKSCVNGTIDLGMRIFKPSSREEFFSCISRMAQECAHSSKYDIEGIAVSVCGEYDYGSEHVVNCWHYPFLVGGLRDDLEERFRCWNVHVVNDGDAHVLALKVAYRQKGLWGPVSAVNLSLGTAVGFGIVDWKGDLLHTCRGHNWEIGNLQCETRENTKDLYWMLGSQGLRSLEERHGNPNAYIYYGQRLASFLGRDLVPLFHPTTIGISGGIVAGHFESIKEGVRKECEERNYCEPGRPLNGVEIYLSPERDSVMLGLAELLRENSLKTVFRRFGKFFERMGSGEIGVTTADDWSMGDFPDAGVVSPAIMNSQNEDWSRYASLDELVATIRNGQSEVSEESLSELIKEAGAFSRIPHAWRTLCGYFGEVSARRLVLEKALCESTRYETDVQVNRPCALVGIHAGKVVCAENGGAAPLVANRRICLGAWELFTVTKNDDGSVSLSSSANGKYVSANPDRGGLLVAEGVKIDAWEKFELKPVSDRAGVFTLWSHITRKYVSVDESAGNVLIANRDIAEAWEEFRIFGETASKK